MAIVKAVVFLFACASVISAYSCPNDGRTFYHADVSTGCQVYHLCRGSEMSTLTCPEGQAFDSHTNECRDQASVHCVETDHGHHHRHKRSEDDDESESDEMQMVHSINIVELREELKELCQEIRALIRAAVKDVAPTVYDQLENHYVPTFKHIKDEVMPFINEKVIPQMEKTLRYMRKVSHRVVEKVHRSFELSNSTHINLVSFSDLATDMAKDLEPVLKLGKYLSDRIVKEKKN